jgi:hypothetical protein
MPQQQLISPIVVYSHSVLLLLTGVPAPAKGPKSTCQHLPAAGSWHWRSILSLVPSSRLLNSLAAE